MTVPPPRTGPLVGLKVLELGHYIAGPFCTRVLADLIGEHRGGGGLALAATHIDLGLAQARELRLERASQELEAAWDHS